ncbi:MAG: long-chain fatty acid--CoA ligase [Pyrinomonadaceae bacterium MAG19_C2-C3]|nr:long-chain fatty acid--CoA ligase [Pyrinomonadaceae bacterium MAG19_C2-C3]
MNRTSTVTSQDELHKVSRPNESSSDTANRTTNETAEDTMLNVTSDTMSDTVHDKPRTLVEMFDRTMRRHAKHDALNFKRDGKWHPISTTEVLTRIANIALGLHSLGVRACDRVALLSENRPEWTLADAGCLFAGAIDVPIYTTLTPAQVRYILNDSAASVLFIQNQKQYMRVREAVAACAGLHHVVFFDEEEESEAGAMTLTELEARGAELARTEPALLDTLKTATKPDDLATIIYTSGTTGDPKGVMLSHANLVSNLIIAGAHLSFKREDSVLSVLPLSHIFERLAMYMHLYRGMSVYYAESMDKIGDNMREVRPTILIAVPRLFEKIYGRIKDTAARGGRVKAALLAWAVDTGKQVAALRFAKKTVPTALRLQHALATRLVFSKWKAATGGRIRLFVSGGAALSEDIMLTFAGAGLPILQGYGLTETSPVIAAATLEHNRPGVVGLPIEGVDVRIAADGEIEVRGANVMRGYYNKPEETAKVFTPDGWFKTGDIGELDHDGYLKITDRKKELFKTSGGKYIAPQPIEALIKGSRFVSQVVLIGNGRKFPAALIVPDWEQVLAYVELKKIDSHTPAELCTHPRIVDLFMRQVEANTPELAQYERVKRIALIEHELTIESGDLTPTLKVKRRVVDEKYKDVIDKLYAE